MQSAIAMRLAGKLVCSNLHHIRQGPRF